MLPFMKPQGWPKKAKIVGEKKYGFDDDEEMQKGCIDELFQALKSGDKSQVKSAIQAIVSLVRNKNASDAR